jgi:hypothetical protein
MFTDPCRIGLGLVTVIGLIPGAVGEEVSATQTAQPLKFVDRFKDEPLRPKAIAPIRFLDSFEKSKSEAVADNRRILVYFTGPGCAWCRVLEARTFTDAEVVDLSRKFAGVELHTDRD